MTAYKLQFDLRSAATFGRGDGVAGLVDEEVEHDGDGLPFLRGRTLKGLLAEECANILYALELQQRATSGVRRLIACSVDREARLRILECCASATPVCLSHCERRLKWQ